MGRPVLSLGVLRLHTHFECVKRLIVLETDDLVYVFVLEFSITTRWA
jgi:hypothetical protein